jgi:hypothetical protein
MQDGAFLLYVESAVPLFALALKVRSGWLGSRVATSLPYGACGKVDGQEASEWVVGFNSFVKGILEAMHMHQDTR